MIITVTLDTAKVGGGSNEQPRQEWTDVHARRPDKYQETDIDAVLWALTCAADQLAGEDMEPGWTQDVVLDFYDGASVVGKVVVSDG